MTTTTIIPEIIDTTTSDTTIISFIIHHLTELKVAMQSINLVDVFGVPITAYGVAISLFVVSMIVWFFSGDGEDDD